MSAPRPHPLPEAAPTPRYTLAELVSYFLRLGTTGFGGPIALVGYMQRDLVEARGWISLKDYKEGLALAQLAPGPLAAQLAGPIMAACRIALPKVRLKLSSAGSIQLATSIREHAIDLAVLFEGEPYAGCVRVPLFDRRLFLLRRANGSVRPGSITFRELADLPLVLPHQPNIVRLVLDRLFAEAGIEPHVAAEADVSADMLAAVQAGVGDTILPLGGTDELPANISAQAIEPAVSLTASIVSSAETPLAAAGEAVRDFIAGFVKQHLSEHPVPGVEPAGE